MSDVDDGDDLTEVDLEDLEDDVIDDDLDDEIGDDLEEVDDLGDGGGEEVPDQDPSSQKAAPAPNEDGDDDDDEVDQDHDVEASLDEILKERMVADEEVDDEEVPDTEDRSDASEPVLPKQPDEFVCRSCFLVKHPSQLANKKKMLCRDCE